MAVSIPNLAVAQAFGVGMGDPVGKYSPKAASDRSNPNFVSITVPEPNPEFVSYVALTDESGVICRVTGVGRDHDNDDYGTETKKIFINMKTALEERYGRNKFFDFIRYGALWNEPREWIWSIYKKERSLSAFWDADEKSNLPPSISSIVLSTKAVSANAAYITLSYEFSNISRCLSARNAAASRGL